MQAPQAPVAIAMATWNGERYLDRQLASISGQDTPVRLYVEDDASTDSTVERLRASPLQPSVHVACTNRGFVASFEAALERALGDDHEWIALADQDDIWDSDRIARGVTLGRKTIAQHGPHTPVLVHSDLRVVDANGALLQPSYLRWRGYAIDDRPGLARVLGENGVMGNTILVNRALLLRALPFPPGLHLHDWWLAMVAELCGIRRLLPEATIDYRVHAGNTSNSVASFDAHRLRSRLVGLPGRLCARDFKMPYLEDRRIDTVRWLLDEHSRFAPLPRASREVLELFCRYARLERPRMQLLLDSERAGLLPSTRSRRLRTALALLFTQRYASGPQG